MERGRVIMHESLSDTKLERGLRGLRMRKDLLNRYFQSVMHI